MPTPADILHGLQQKEERLVCGLMSGTSVDAVDAALVRIRGKAHETSIEVVCWTELPFSDEVRNVILGNTDVSTSNVSDICMLQVILGHLYADAVEACCEEAGIDPATVDLIGMHGQTLYHLPNPVAIAEREVAGTFQAGSAPVLAYRTGTPVVSDFRSADIAAGGQGAPLLPYVDYLLFGSDSEHRVLLNIGGIANITWLPPDAAEDQIVAFDSGPGNMVVNALMERLYERSYDLNGEVACKGRLNQDLFSWMIGHEYFRRALPKSTGREVFGGSFIDELLEIARELDVTSPEDIISTASQLTVKSIAIAIEQVTQTAPSFRVYAAGGGARNKFFMDGLHHALGPGKVQNFDALGISPDAREAISFAVLANEWLHGIKANLPAVTGASKKVLLGSVTMP
ncbi:MAG: anhydro-N-acetylmuramic acid kinase [Ectothiorhodospiraceae bacterium]|nr:anhydro-N-acetylmuramic acid kinase [Ectothiorhodospiraceae bacterium]